MEEQCAGVFLCVLLCLLVQVGSQSNSLLEYRIMEELPRGTLIGNIVNDARLSQKYTRGDLRHLRFSFLDQPDLNFNAIDIEETTGMLRISRRIDRDDMCPHQPICEVFLDVAVRPAQYFQVINMKIEIMDSNDNKPTFPQKEIMLEISEATPAGMGFALPLAEDPDSGSFSVQMYELASRSLYFDIRQTNRGLGETDLKLVLRQQLDREQQDFYQIRVAAFDGGVPAKYDRMTINITVTDANDNRPKFNNQTYTVTVAENAPFNHTILQVHATDRDIGVNGKLKYDFTDRTREHYGEIFGINSKSGAIYLRKPLDFEKESIYHLVVSANDGGPKLEPGTAAVIVKVRDINDNAPQISINTLTPSGRAEVEENSAIGAFVAHISAKDQDSDKNGEVVCFMTDSRFHLEHLQRTQYKIVTGIGLDREKEARFEVLVTCQDLGEPRQSTTETITVTVLDKNDHAPSFSKKYYSYRIRENNRVNAILVTVNATDKDRGSNAVVTYRLPSDAGNAFKIHPSSGAIRANIPFDYETKEEYRFHVVAEDRGTPRKTASAVVMITILDVNDEVPKFQKQSYSFKVTENQAPHKTIGIVSATDRDAEPYNRIRYTLAPIGSTDYFEVHAETGRILTLQRLDREKKPIHYLTVEASNPGFSGMSSSVSVTIHVVDENDNIPVIDFPNENNNTIYLPNHLPLDYVVTRIIAHDDDDPQTNNAKLGYTIADGNEDRFFKMDPTTGAVSVDSDLGSIESALFSFKIRVTDLGLSQHLTWATLNIVVNKSLTIDFIGQPTGLTEINRTIVIALTIASAIVMAILIVAIIIIKSCDGRHRKGSRTKKTTQNMLSTKDTKDVCDSQNISNHSTLGSMDGSLKKEVTFNIKMEDPPPPVKRQYPPSPSSQSSTSSSERVSTICYHVSHQFRMGCVWPPNLTSSSSTQIARVVGIRYYV